MLLSMLPGCRYWAGELGDNAEGFRACEEAELHVLLFFLAAPMLATGGWFFFRRAFRGPPGDGSQVVSRSEE